MAISLQALDLENQSVGIDGKPTLAAAYGILRDGWLKGDRDRELCLHLMFLCWYLGLEPPHITGAFEEVIPSTEFAKIFNDVFQFMAPAPQTDPEFLYVVGLMSAIAPWVLGDNDIWEMRSHEYQVMYRKLKPDGIDPEVFEGRGAFGDYFAHQARIKNGY